MVQEAAVVAELPLPPEMQHLEQIFQALNAVHSFLLSAHIQVHIASCPASVAQPLHPGKRMSRLTPQNYGCNIHFLKPLNGGGALKHRCLLQATWRNVRKAVRNIPGAQGAQLSDVEAMADLCPGVVIVRNRHR